jgi:hypothetical protein
LQEPLQRFSLVPSRSLHETFPLNSGRRIPPRGTGRGKILSGVHCRDLTSFYRAMNSPFTYMLPGIVETSFLRFGETLGTRQHKRNIWSWDSTDRSSLGIESETTQTGIDWGGPRVAPCLREAPSATISETGFSHWRRPHASIDQAAGAAVVGMFLRLRAICCVAAFQLSPRQRKHILPDQLRVHPKRIGWSNRGRESRSHRQ